MIARVTPHPPTEIEPTAGPAVPAWVATMRAAAQKMVTPADIEQIVANQVEAAKRGDRNAIRFVFEQVLGGAQPKAATFIQNNYHGPAEPTPAAGADDGPAGAAPTPAPAMAEWVCSKCEGVLRQATPPGKCGCGNRRFNRRA